MLDMVDLQSNPPSEPFNEGASKLSPKDVQEYPGTGKCPHSCYHCRKIIIRQPSRPSRHGFRCRLPYTVREAYQAAKDGCSIYKLLIRGYLFAIAPREINWLTRAMLGKPDIRLPRAGVFGEQERIVYLAEALSKQPFQIRFDNKDQALFICLAWGSNWFQVNAWPDDPLTSLFPVRPINREVASPESFELARRWLNECANHGSHSHLLCPDTIDMTFLPKRLLEIRTNKDSYSIRLRETSSGQVHRYACLSYCWGGDQPVKTTKATLAQRQAGINFKSLPKTLQDAIKATVQLELEYLWIDCLCMIQDDKDDMITQLPKMPEIYKNAYVTISASSANTCYEGFLQRRQIPSEAQCEDVILKYKSSTERIGNVYLFEDQSKNITDPISKRAWTLQERRISPRFLDFSTHQLRWTCNSRQYYDGGLEAGILDSQAQISTDERKSDTKGPEIIEHAIFKTWADIVDDYTQRLLSFPDDKLVALGAMASEVGAGLNMKYLAGLWNEHLPSQLLWRLWGEPSKRLEKYRAPSWSWASVDGWVMMEHETHAERVSVEIIKCDTILQTGDFIHGPVTSGSLTLKGHLLPAFWFPNQEGGLALEGAHDGDFNEMGFSDNDSEEDSTDVDMTDVSDDSNSTESIETTSSVANAVMLDGVETIPDAVEPDWNTEDENFAVEVRCLRVLAQADVEGSAGLILMPSEPSAPTYRRVGYFSVDSRKRDFFADAAEETITIF